VAQGTEGKRHGDLWDERTPIVRFPART
jgi:hypothetical protein